MRVELNAPESVREPRMWVKHQAVLAMALRPGSFELGLRRSEMIRLTYDAGEMSLVPRYFEKWFRTDDLHYLSVGISDAALTAAADGASGEVELRRADNLFDPRLQALASLQASLRAQAMHAYLDLSTLIADVERLFRAASPKHLHASLFYGEYDSATRVLRYVNAGHNAPMVLRWKGSECKILYLEPSGTPIGLLEISHFSSQASKACLRAA